MPSIRQASSTDASKLSELLEQTFRDTFAASNTAEDMELHCLRSYTEPLQAAELADPAMTTLVAEHEGRLVGVVQLHWGEAPTCVIADQPGEIQRLYIDKKWHGTGLARELMNHAMNVLQTRGVDKAWLGVWEHNPRAIAFYRKYGFTEVGDHVFMVGTDPQRDIVMIYPLDSK